MRTRWHARRSRPWWAATTVWAAVSSAADIALSYLFRSCSDLAGAPALSPRFARPPGQRQGSIPPFCRADMAGVESPTPRVAGRHQQGSDQAGAERETGQVGAAPASGL